MKKRYVSLLLCFILGFCLFALPAAAADKTVNATYGDTSFTVGPYSSVDPDGLYTGSDENGTKVANVEIVMYEDEKEYFNCTWFETGPNVGTHSYSLKYRDDNEGYKTDTITLTVNQKPLTRTAESEPAAETLSYTGAAQALVSAGEGGSQPGVYDQTVVTQLEYALGDSATTAPTTGWSITVPTATDAGSYYVWWRVGPKSVSGETGSAEPSNYAASEPTCIPVSIGKAAITPTLTFTGWTYGGPPSTPTLTGNAGNGEVDYYYNETGNTSAGDGFNAANLVVGKTYYLFAEISETENYQRAFTKPVEFTIAPAEIDVTKFEIGKMTYTGEAQSPTVTIEAATVDGCDYTVTYSTDGENYSEELPTFTDAGTYRLHVRISAPNHEDADFYDDVTVEEPAPAATATPAPTATPSASAKPAQSPKTGDEAMPILWILIVVIAVAAVVVLLIVRRKKTK